MKKIEVHNQDNPNIETNSLGREENLGIKLDDKLQRQVCSSEEKGENKMLVEDIVSEVMGVTGPKHDKSDVSKDQNSSSPVKKFEKQKPAWLLKLEQLQLRSLDELSKPK